MESLQPASSTVVPCSELEVSEIVKYWLKLKNYQVNQEDKLKCINSASKLTKPSTESLGPIVHIMREALLDEDTFVRYSAAIAMGDILNDHFDNINFTHVFNDMVSSMSTMEYGWRVSILDLLWHHLSQSESRKNCYVAVTVVGQRWMYLCELCLFDCLDECKSSSLIKQTSEKISELEGVLKDISVQLAKSFVDCFSPEWFEEFPSDFKDGFGGELTINSKSQQNFLICRIVGNICIKLVSVVPGLDIDSSSSNLSSSFRVLISLDACVGRTTSLYHFLWVPAVYSEQDDAWINILMTLLEIYIDRKSRLQEEEACTGTQDVLNMIQPHKQFLLFLDNTGFDDTLIVDLLISPETCFLAYFTKYLRLVSSEWTDFVSTHFEYTANTSVDSRLDNGENVHSEAELFSEDENPLTSLDKEYDTVKNSGPELTISHGLALLHQYGDNDEEETDNEEDIKTSMGKPCVHNEIDHTTEPQFDVFPPKINKCLEETMSVLIKVRLKIEKYKDSSILPYDPTVLIHLIEKVEEIYEE